MSSSVFADLIVSYPTWTALKEFLSSEAGGKVFVYEIHEEGMAMLRYIKGVSDLSLPHVGAFRSVVWNTITNRPISVTPYKSEIGEGMPAMSTQSNQYTVEVFEDGVLIGQFWDGTQWRLHTRSMLGAVCRYYSKTHTFAQLFAEAAPKDLEDHLDKSVCYSWILQHPSNRIVVPVHKPRLMLVQQTRVDAETGSVQLIAETPDTLKTMQPHKLFHNSRLDMCRACAVSGCMNVSPDFLGPLPEMPSGYVASNIIDAIQTLTTMGGSGSIRYQGIVIKSSEEPFRRWKMRATYYNDIRKLRGNSCRLDFHCMDLWSKGQLAKYLRAYPEERMEVDLLVHRWKAVSQQVYRLYTEAFKARTLDRSAIPAKFRPLVYGLHTLYMETLRPEHKSLDWMTACKWLNERDTAQKIHVLNWDLRQERDLLKNSTATTAIPEAPVV